MKKLLFSKINLFFILLLLVSLMFTEYALCASKPGDVI